MPDPELADAESDAPADVPSWVSALAEGDEPAQSEAPGLPDWFSSLTTEDTTMIAAPATRLPIDEDDTPVTSGQAAPDWFTDPEAADVGSMRRRQPCPTGSAPCRATAPGGEYDAPKPEKPALPEWFDEPVAAEPASAEPAAEEPTLTAGDALPDWLTEMTPDEPVVKPSTQPIQPTTPAPQPPLPPAEVPAELGSETPDWLNELASGPVALTMAFDDDDPAQPPEPATPAPADDGDDLPPELAWSPADDEAPTSDDLSQAEIPAWLSAMRPTDVQGRTGRRRSSARHLHAASRETATKKRSRPRRHARRVARRAERGAARQSRQQYPHADRHRVAEQSRSRCWPRWPAPKSARQRRARRRASGCRSCAGSWPPCSCWPPSRPTWRPACSPAPHR